jgi:hypothetical protein
MQQVDEAKVIDGNMAGERKCCLEPRRVKGK